VATGVPVLTNKGRDALKTMPLDLSARHRSILVLVDGKRSLDDISTALRKLEGLEEGIARLISDGYVQVEQSCKDVIKQIAERSLGVKSPAITRKLDELHAKYGDACWQHLDELDKAARLFLGADLADKLKADIQKVLNEVKK